MRVVEAPKVISVTVELSGQDVQLIQRALLWVCSPDDQKLKEAEVALLSQFNDLLKAAEQPELGKLTNDECY